MARPLGIETITILRAPLVASSRDNSQQRDWPNAVTHDLLQCNVQPFILSEKYTAEINTEREYLTVLFKVWAPAGSDVLYTDRAQWRGTEYEILGLTGNWDHIMGGEHHKSFLLRLRQG